MSIQNSTGIITCKPRNMAEKINCVNDTDKWVTPGYINQSRWIIQIRTAIMTYLFVKQDATHQCHDTLKQKSKQLGITQHKNTKTKMEPSHMYWGRRMLSTR